MSPAAPGFAAGQALVPCHGGRSGPADGPGGAADQRRQFASRQLGDSNQLQVGDWVVTIGNALALTGGPTVTQGVVSALGRTVQEPGAVQGMDELTSRLTATAVRSCSTRFRPMRRSTPATLRTAREPLGSGDWYQYTGCGRAEPGVQAQGIGFAISIATAKPIADQLVTSGQVVHPYIGIQYVPLNPALAARLGVQAQDGMVVGQVVPGSPAAAAGLRQQDIITAIDAQPLQGESALAEAINGHKPGDTITLTLLRGRQQSQRPGQARGDCPATLKWSRMLLVVRNRHQGPLPDRVPGEAWRPHAAARCPVPSRPIRCRYRPGPWRPEPRDRDTAVGASAGSTERPERTNRSD